MKNQPGVKLKNQAVIYRMLDEKSKVLKRVVDKEPFLRDIKIFRTEFEVIEKTYFEEANQ